MTRTNSSTAALSPSPVTRRKILHALGVGLLAAPFVRSFGCGGDGGTGTADLGSGTDGSAATDAAASGDIGSSGPWATGGTAAMTAKASYPDPFTAGLGSACTLYCAATIGPCYAQTVTRQDISEGHDGLPLRIVFQVVDETCTPLSDATVDIWHCGPEGLYSGNDASDFCTNGDATARAARWFRGVQPTDAKGRVTFDTCFPGWYSSRTIHVHFTVRIGTTEYVTSQLVFADTLDDQIVANQPLYNTRGQRDTQNTNDNVVGGAAQLSDFTFQTARMSDGAMLAWKTLVVRRSTATALCEVGGGGGMGPGDGGFGPPPDGGFGPRPDGGMGPRPDGFAPPPDAL